MPRSNELFDEIAQLAKTVKMRATSDELFDEIDTDKNGTIEDHELLLHCVDKGMPEGAIAQLFQKLDVDSDGHISREEWTEGFSLYEFIASQHTSPPATRGGRGPTTQTGCVLHVSGHWKPSFGLVSHGWRSSLVGELRPY
jgi:hypothetical protein